MKFKIIVGEAPYFCGYQEIENFKDYEVKVIIDVKSPVDNETIEYLSRTEKMLKLGNSDYDSRVDISLRELKKKLREKNIDFEILDWDHQESDDW